MPASSMFCTHCGTPLRMPPDRAGPIAAPHSRTWVWVVVAVVIAIVVVLPSLLAYLAFQQLSPLGPPALTPIQLQFTGPSCPGWSNETLVGAGGGGTAGRGVPLHVPASSGSCAAESVSIPTPGFTLVSSNTPLTVDAGGYGQLNVTVRTPSTPPPGNATMIVAVGDVTAAAVTS